MINSCTQKPLRAILFPSLQNPSYLSLSLRVLFSHNSIVSSLRAMDANDNLDPELSWGFVGGDDADTNNRSYLFGCDYKESTILSEFGWNIPGDPYGCGHGFSDLDRIDSDFAGRGADGRASAPPCDDVCRSGEETVVVVEENSTSASVLASNPSMSSSSLEDPSEKSTVSGSSTAANPPPDTASKGKKKGEKRNGEARFAFVTKSEIDNLEDGYRWRKYGQKAVKNSRFPRSYYRCTNSKCRVKKRVERWWEDPSVVITTYEGQHCHESVGGTRARRPLQYPPPPPPPPHHILPDLLVPPPQGLLGDIVPPRMRNASG